MLNISELSPAKEQNVFDESKLTSPEFRTLGRMIQSMERNSRRVPKVAALDVSIIAIADTGER